MPLPRVVFASSSHVEFVSSILMRAVLRAHRWKTVGLLFPIERMSILSAAKTHNIEPIPLIYSLKNQTAASRSLEFFSHCTRLGADIIVLVRYLHLLAIPENYAGRVINVHGSLLPDFGGVGLYGFALQEKVLQAGIRITGCTVHVVTDQYDQGEILIQKPYIIKQGETAATLHSQIMGLEIDALIDVIDTLTSPSIDC